VKDIALHLNVKMPSVNSALKILMENELIVHESYGHVEMTKKGLEYAQEIYRRHKLISHFFQEVLGVSYEIADDDACRVEHVLSSETIESLAGFMQAIEENSEKLPEWLTEFREDTRKKRVVTRSEGFIKKGLVNLTKAPEGSQFLIRGIDGGPGVTKRLAMLGLLPDTIVDIISAQQGQVILEVKGAKIALGGGMANKLWGKIR
jgi:DtxR family Mn-dependent transcriptional regulator